MGTRTLWLFSLAGAAILATSACGRSETTASRSAAAYDEAQRKGTAPSGGRHGGQAAQPQTLASQPPAPAAEHAGHGAQQAEKSAGADHPRAGHQMAPGKQPPMAGMDHSKTTPAKPGAADAHAGHKTPQAQKTDPMAGMDHSKHTATPPTADAHAGHGTTSGEKPIAGTAHAGHSQMTPMPPPLPEPKTATATPGQPGETLKPDALDAPAQTSIEDANRSAAMAKEMASGGHGMTHGTYRQIDAGRVGAPPASPDAHKGHEQPKPKPSPASKP